jgi:hypothetical protein
LIFKNLNQGRFGSNLNQGEGDGPGNSVHGGSSHSKNKESSDAEKKNSVRKSEHVDKSDEGCKHGPNRKGVLNCSRCGKMGHKPEDCLRPVACSRCKKEGHVPRVCTEIMPWECIAPFFGLSAPC